ncbi:MAG: response regulator [Muribaculaceae bacterium]|nr:response regulator [Muribaculaceae bacterium]
MRTICLRIVMSCIALCAAGAGHAAVMDSVMRFHIINLPYEANVVERIVKDSQGMMWLATRRGIFSYDGYNLRRLAEGNYHALTLLENDILCAGGDNGLLWLDLHTERPTTPWGPPPATGEVRALFFHQGTLFVGSKSQGLFMLDTQHGKWKQKSLPGGRNDIIFSFEPVGEKLYVAHHGGMACLDRDGHLHDMGVTDNVYAIMHDPMRACLWLGTEHRLSRYDLTDGSLTTVASGGTYNQIVGAASGLLLLATENGLTVFDPSTGTSHTTCHDAASPQNSLPSNTIHQIYLDGANVWIATDRGVAFLPVSSPVEITPLPWITNSRDGNVFSQMIIDHNGTQWLGGDNGLLRIDRQGVKWFKTGSGLKKNIIRRIYEDRDHEIWIATDASIARFNRMRNAFDYFEISDHHGRNANWAYDIYEDPTGRLWIATYMGGLYVVDKKELLASKGKLILPDNALYKADEMVNTIYQFLPDDKGTLWASTNKGLVSINTTTLAVTRVLNKFINHMLMVDGTLWLDVQGGLFRFDTRTGTCTDTGFSVADGTIWAFVHEKQRVWMSTSQGLFYIDTIDGSVHPHSRPSATLTTGTYHAADGTILWGGEDVVCRQSLRDLVSDDVLPRVFISSISVAAETAPHIVARFGNEIDINGRDDIIIELATFDYCRRNQEVFWYKIGADGEWHSLLSGTNRIVLPHLPAGTYQLYFSTVAGTDNAKSTLYTLHVPYPWYQRWWAWLIWMLAATALVWLVIERYRRREKAQFAQRERERVMTLTQQKMDFFVNMSHELKTPLSLIIGPLSKLISDTSNAKLRSNLKTIHNHALRLNELIHGILDSKQMEMESENQVLSSSIDLYALISSSIDEFEQVASQRHIAIALDSTPAPPFLINVDVAKLQIVMRNLLSNAMKFVADDSGEIHVAIEGHPGRVTVTVSDNGPGVPDSELTKIFNRYYMAAGAHDGSGIGLSVVKKYVELHGGEVKAINNHGLSVQFTLPFNAVAPAAHEEEWNTPPAGLPWVLIVDDNREILDFLTQALQSSYHCATAASGKEALAQMELHTPDLIITDQMMPGMDGTSLCHAIRHNHSTAITPIIMLTAKDDSQTEMKSLQSGADVFMPKPFDLRKLQLHIVQLLNKRKAIESATKIAQMNQSPDRQPVTGGDEQLMERIVTLIDENMHSEEFNVNKLSQLMCMEPKQLYRKIKLLTGDAPVSFIRRQRMKRAASLLKHEGFTVAEVMYQVGYSSPSYFSKCFAREYGITPTEYAGVNCGGQVP